MRVLYVLRYYPTLTETFVLREIAELHRRGVEVRVAALGRRDDGASPDALPPVPVVRPPRGLGSVRLVGPVLRLLSGPDRASWRARTRHLRPKDALRVAWLAREARWADRLHVHFAGEAAVWAAAAAKLAGVPWGVMVHAVDLFRPRPELPDLLRSAQPLLTVAEHHRAWIRERHGVDARVLRCGPPVDGIPAADPGRHGGPLRVISVGRWVPKKGLDLLVDACARDGHALRLVSPGAPPLPFPAGPVPPARVPALLAEAQLFALPARVAQDGDRDGVPVALMEAMAARLPVLTTPVAGIPELVDERVGWLVPPDEPAALRAALAEIAHSPAERALRGARGPARLVERGFTLEAQVSGLLDAWAAS